MRLQPDESKLFGTTNVIDNLKSDFTNLLQTVHTVGSFDNVSSYIDRFSVGIPVLGNPYHKIGQDDLFPAGNESFSRGCSRDTMIPGKEIIVYIPFEGDPRIFYHMPSEFLLSGRQEGKVEDNKLVMRFGVFTYSETEKITESINRQKKDIIKCVERWFALAEKDFVSWNENLQSYIENQISIRKNSIEKIAAINKAINDTL